MNLLENEDSYQVTSVIPQSSVRGISAVRMKNGLRIDLPSSIPIFSFFQQKGMSLSVFTWLQAIIRLKILFRRTKFDVCWTGDLVPASLGFVLKYVQLCDKLVYDDPDYYPICYSGVLRILTKFMETLVVRYADLIISISPEIARIRKQQGAKNVQVVPHGVDYDFFEIAYEERLKRVFGDKFKPTVILFAGNFSDEFKNDLVLNALEKLYKNQQKFLFLIVGAGNQTILNRFMTAAKSMGFDNCIKYLGSVPRRKLPEIFEKADIGLCKLTPTYLLYGTTKKILEYMAAGLPVIASSIGPASDLVQEANAGFVALPKAENLAEAISRALNMNSEEYSRKSRNARVFVKQYDWNLLSETYREIIQTLD